MKTIAVALSVVMLAGGVADTQARGFRLRGSSASTPLPSTPSLSTARRIPSIAAVGAISSTAPAQAVAGATIPAVMTTQAQAADLDDNTPIPPMPPAPGNVTVAKPAQPWCPSGRTVGAGTGFCLIN